MEVQTGHVLLLDFLLDMCACTRRFYLLLLYMFVLKIFDGLD